MLPTLLFILSIYVIAELWREYREGEGLSVIHYHGAPLRWWMGKA